MHVEDIRRESRGGGVELSARVRVGNRGVKERIRFRFPESVAGAVRPVGTPFLAALLLPAMRAGRDLRVAGPVDPRVLESLPRLMEIFSGWIRRARPVRIHATPGDPLPRARGPVATFFSGGVDSFHTLLSHRGPGADPPITHLLFVRGFDIDLGHPEFSARAERGVAAAAAATGTTAVPIVTNLRQLTEGRVSWDFEHGPAMAAVAHGLPGFFHTVFVPASHVSPFDLPWGSHPATDPLWSSGATTFVHDGGGCTRYDKIRSTVARSDAALAHLRVCFRTRGARMNCGVCEKCVRTKIDLLLAGALSRCATFSDEIDPAVVRKLLLAGASSIGFLDVCRQHLAREGVRPDLQAAIAAAIRRSRLFQPVAKLVSLGLESPVFCLPARAVRGTLRRSRRREEPR